ncbi:MAG TPA: rRNA maturation RNase YbeY [Candidatus Paceibacterota bacterium]|nr:rRNA maturation RNase YbeY [Candidatus Paceibacterota bacterium]HRZ34604.1 rRNA maturation RNase YbeY [Candidatus Paceibacterota bacterium]
MFQIKKLFKKPLPKPFSHYRKIAEAILGKAFELSLVFISKKESKKLNKKFRHKNKVANVLSFQLGKNYGEIFITIERAEDEAKKFEMSTAVYIDYLLIHGALHLLGLDHGKKMERAENKFLTTYSHTK